MKEVEWATPGTAAGLAVLQSFIAERLKNFGSHRNNPNKEALSNLSPWFHFGECPRLPTPHGSSDQQPNLLPPHLPRPSFYPTSHPGGAETAGQVQGVSGCVRGGGCGAAGAG